MRVHVVGAGLAGLAAGLSLTARGMAVTVHEAGPAAGGRCRSYFDRELGLTIDNGNHLLLSGNRAAFDFLREIGAADRLGGPAAPIFPFFEPGSGRRWTLRLSAGRMPWWLFAPARRVPETRLGDYVRMLALARIGNDATVAGAMPDGALYRRLVAPLAVAALNTPPEEGLARLLGAVMRESLLRGGAACLPRFPRAGLSYAFVDPAIETLRARGAELRFGRRVAALDIVDGRVAALRTAEGTLALAAGDALVLAVPPWVAADLLPGLAVPDAFQAILNIHFAARADPGEAGLIGLVGGTAEWVFVKSDHVSITISAANRLVERPAEELAASVWPEAYAALRLPEGPLPPSRVVKEKRATFAATEAQERRRPGARVPGLANLALAGDWTATGLPATIEGAIRSGRRAAEAVLGG
ncbi:MAG TPA: hydroxysqualene dehydroxylase HpnE [Acetobacteraceae bacterium]|nr:hydroxysqualene dehydroxylase HpnE [Acetobacteraceae bacterium]